MLKLTIYNFEIFYRAEKLNLIDILSRCFNYKGISLFNIKLLLTL